MLDAIKLENVLFLDIETVPLHPSFNELDHVDQQLYADKTKYQRKEEYTPDEFYDRAGIWAEFGKIVCISVGYFVDRTYRQFRVRSFTGTEVELLEEFSTLLKDHFSGQHHLLCAHNGKEFDFPYIARRMIINGIAIPAKLNLFGKKPWEVPHLDTMELWKFGDYKHFTSLKLMTRVLGIPSPKDDIDGSQVRNVYYEENDVNRIARYCEKDVIAVAQILLKLRLEPILKDDQIITK
ncbi:3'-5' exonuclease [Nonlabens ulvanivorans]|uniref:3'-5' exonuclease n=1 Tax=Nonlabens ulvanivorans TaxID=906888 RepID=UPI0032637711